MCEPRNFASLKIGTLNRSYWTNNNNSRESYKLYKCFETFRWFCLFTLITTVHRFSDYFLFPHYSIQQDFSALAGTFYLWCACHSNRPPQRPTRTCRHSSGQICNNFYRDISLLARFRKICTLPVNTL